MKSRHPFFSSIDTSLNHFTIESNFETIFQALKTRICPSEQDIKNICEKAKEILIKEDNVVRLKTPISVCGDIHGQFSDLLELFLVGGTVPETSYCFMGDYVDRGHYSLLTLLFLLMMKIKHPDKITLLRGNHESRPISEVYGFYAECVKLFSNCNVYNYCTDVFDCLPICAVINDSFFVVHGGLGPDSNSIDDINSIDRIQETNNSTLVTNLLWSDPDDEMTEEFLPSTRGAGFIFSRNAVDKFNLSNGIDCILRAHQLCDAGYKIMFDESLITVWSAPNYCYRCGNTASILQIENSKEKKFLIFTEAPKEKNDKAEESDATPAYFL